MEEHQVSIEGITHMLEAPFFVLATQNPIEQEGTYPLPEAQMDRFMFRLSMGYASSREEESLILSRRIDWQKDDPTGDVEPVVSQDQFRHLSGLAESSVYVDPQILGYVADMVRGSRDHPRVSVGSSPRGGLALVKAARAMALTHGRDFVTPDDIKLISTDTLAHRLILNIEDVLEGVSEESIVEEVVNQVEVPTEFQRAP
jgi:MoxR-like ATPase